MQDAAAFITLGEGIDIGLDRDNILFIQKQTYANGQNQIESRINLGPATEQSAEHLKTYIDRLVELAKAPGVTTQ